jgi:YHS domain-containing protein
MRKLIIIIAIVVIAAFIAKVNGRDYYNYDGKRYGLCCPACRDMFSIDSAKYAARTGGGGAAKRHTYEQMAASGKSDSLSLRWKNR